MPRGADLRILVSILGGRSVLQHVGRKRHSRRQQLKIRQGCAKVFVRGDRPVVEMEGLQEGLDDPML